MENIHRRKNWMIVLLSSLLFLSSVSTVSAHHHPNHQEVSEQNESDQSDSGLASHSKSAILMERDTGKVLFEKNADEPLPPASMTKVMTMLLIMEALEEETITLNEKVRISENAASLGGSQIFLEAGEEMTIKDLLKGVAVASGNDASVALAERIAGSEKRFVEMMNEKAEELGLEDTHFKNPTGLPADNHVSTARDMAKMSRALLQYESITDYTGIYEDYLREGEENEFWLVNTNKLVKFYEGVDGLKTGFTNEAKYCLTATAEIDDMRTIAVVMGADTTKERNSDVSQLLDYAYNKYTTKPLFDKGQSVTTFDWLKANKSNVDVVTDDSVSIVHEKGVDIENIKTQIKMKQDVSLPLTEGTVVGKLEVVDKNQVLSQTDLVVSENMNKANVFQLFGRTLQSFFN
ncbi:D-alanyl-D-alanine carboxypeptidase [Gracilibacillus halophilus YIM-C55.5]|uniref:serine-type D-Ala-D-Ala carboxypeptidase n=1 Tax=Gracilibacillus halophilus YIM-C55.5 TaxID=1308866 RepID=N4WMI3_9BACI|nr:D-alanyl-D-alanine carboxypeptidase family protein [Gracilibacillus halophilus]ENH97392.1 D-alanyl-D-alanine carboxypeptidase [Gracilibacillus halophilus YIM-C55.5]